MSNLENVPRRLAIGTKVLSIASLSQRGELALIETLRGIISDGLDVWRRFKPLLDHLKDQEEWGDRAQLVELAGRLVAAGGGLTLEDINRARRTNATVLAREIYHRAKPYHGDLELREVEACVTSTNVGDLYAALEEALGAKDDPKATRSPSQPN